MSADTGEGHEQIRLQSLPDNRFMGDYIDGTYDSETAYVAPPEASSNDFIAPEKQWNAEKKTFSFNFAFNVGTGGPVEVNVHERDLMELFRENASFDPSMADVDLTKTVVTQTSILGSTLKKNANYALKLYDAQGRPMYTKHGFKTSDDAVWRKYGVPLYATKKTLMQADDGLDRDLKLYGALTMDDITANTVPLSYPGTLSEPPSNYMFVPKEPNGLFFVWALEQQNKELKHGTLMNNPAFQDPNKAEYFRLPATMYEAVVNAYQEKLNNDVKFYDLTNIKAVLTPLSTHTSPSSDTQHDFESMKPDHFENIAIEFTAYMAPKKKRPSHSRASEQTRTPDDFTQQDYATMLSRMSVHN